MSVQFLDKLSEEQIKDQVMQVLNYSPNVLGEGKYPMAAMVSNLSNILKEELRANTELGGALDNSLNNTIEAISSEKYKKKLDGLKEGDLNSFLVVPMVAVEHIFGCVIRKDNNGNFECILVNKGNRPKGKDGVVAQNIKYIIPKEKIGNCVMLSPKEELYIDTDIDNKVTRDSTTDDIYNIFENNCIGEPEELPEGTDTEQKKGNCYYKEIEAALKYACYSSRTEELEYYEWPADIKDIHEKFVKNIKEEVKDKYPNLVPFLDNVLEVYIANKEFRRFQLDEIEDSKLGEDELYDKQLDKFIELYCDGDEDKLLEGLKKLDVQTLMAYPRFFIKMVRYYNENVEADKKIPVRLNVAIETLREKTKETKDSDPNFKEVNEKLKNMIKVYGKHFEFIVDEMKLEIGDKLTEEASKQYEEKKYDEVKILCEAAVDANPNDAYANYYYGMTLFDMDEFKMAGNYLRRASLLSPADSVYKNSYIESLVNMKEKSNHDEIRELCNKEIEQEPDDEFPYYYLGQIEIVEGNYKDAYTHLQKAIELNPRENKYQELLKTVKDNINEELKNVGKEESKIDIYDSQGNDLQESAIKVIEVVEDLLEHVKFVSKEERRDDLSQLEQELKGKEEKNKDLLGEKLRESAKEVAESIKKLADNIKLVPQDENQKLQHLIKTMENSEYFVDVLGGLKKLSYISYDKVSDENMRDLTELLDELREEIGESEYDKNTNKYKMGDELFSETEMEYLAELTGAVMDRVVKTRGDKEIIEIYVNVVIDAINNDSLMEENIEQLAELESYDLVSKDKLKDILEVLGDRIGEFEKSYDKLELFVNKVKNSGVEGLEKEIDEFRVKQKMLRAPEKTLKEILQISKWRKKELREIEVVDFEKITDIKLLEEVGRKLNIVVLEYQNNNLDVPIEVQEKLEELSNKHDRLVVSKIIMALEKEEQVEPKEIEELFKIDYKYIETDTIIELLYQLRENVLIEEKYKDIDMNELVVAIEKTRDEKMTERTVTERINEELIKYNDIENERKSLIDPLNDLNKEVTKLREEITKMEREGQKIKQEDKEKLKIKEKEKDELSELFVRLSVEANKMEKRIKKLEESRSEYELESGYFYSRLNEFRDSVQIMRDPQKLIEAMVVKDKLSKREIRELELADFTKLNDEVLEKLDAKMQQYIKGYEESQEAQEILENIESDIKYEIVVRTNKRLENISKKAEDIRRAEEELDEEELDEEELDEEELDEEELDEDELDGEDLDDTTNRGVKSILDNLSKDDISYSAVKQYLNTLKRGTIFMLVSKKNIKRLGEVLGKIEEHYKDDLKKAKEISENIAQIIKVASADGKDIKISTNINFSDKKEKKEEKEEKQVEIKLEELPLDKQNEILIQKMVTEKPLVIEHYEMGKDEQLNLDIKQLERDMEIFRDSRDLHKMTILHLIAKEIEDIKNEADSLAKENVLTQEELNKIEKNTKLFKKELDDFGSKYIIDELENIKVPLKFTCVEDGIKLSDEISDLFRQARNLSQDVANDIEAVAEGIYLNKIHIPINEAFAEEIINSVRKGDFKGRDDIKDMIHISLLGVHEGGFRKPVDRLQKITACVNLLSKQTNTRDAIEILKEAEKVEYNKVINELKTAKENISKYGMKILLKEDEPLKGTFYAIAKERFNALGKELEEYLYIKNPKLRGTEIDISLYLKDGDKYIEQIIDKRVKVKEGTRRENSALEELNKSIEIEDEKTKSGKLKDRKDKGIERKGLV